MDGHTHLEDRDRDRFGGSKCRLVRSVSGVRTKPRQLLCRERATERCWLASSRSFKNTSDKASCNTSDIESYATL